MNAKPRALPPNAPPPILTNPLLASNWRRWKSAMTPRCVSVRKRLIVSAAAAAFVGATTHSRDIRPRMEWVSSTHSVSS